MSRAVLTPFAVARSEKGLTLSQLSAAVGYDRGGLSRIERGKYRPRPALAIKIADLLGVTRDQIMFPEDYMGKGGKKPVRSALSEEAQ